MEDKDIIALYWARSEEALRVTAEKYGAYCAAIIRRILGDSRDGEECLNDTWLGAWNAMPPQKPAHLPPFLGRIARNIALDRRDYNTAQMRGSGGFDAVLEELAECVGGGGRGKPYPAIWTPCPRHPGWYSSGGTGTATPWRKLPSGTASVRGR